MTFSTTQRWLLLSAAALALLSAASWWMPASREAMPADGRAEDMGQGKALSTPSRSPAKTAGRADAPPHPTETGGTAEGKMDADDFQQYAAALRAQGYAEKTVRELTASRITAAFQTRRTAIRSQARQGTAGAADTQAQLDALNREQGMLIGRLLGAEEPEAVPAVAAVEALPGTGEKQVLMPAVMAEALPATVKTEEQAADWAKLRDEFVNAIGGAGQDPASPQYRKRWVEWQSEADQRFRLLFGDTAFVQHQMQAQREALLRQQGLAK